MNWSDIGFTDEDVAALYENATSDAGSGTLVSKGGWTPQYTVRDAGDSGVSGPGLLQLLSATYSDPSTISQQNREGVSSAWAAPSDGGGVDVYDTRGFRPGLESLEGALPTIPGANMRSDYDDFLREQKNQDAKLFNVAGEAFSALVPGLFAGAIAPGFGLRGAASELFGGGAGGMSGLSAEYLEGPLGEADFDFTPPDSFDYGPSLEQAYDPLQDYGPSLSSPDPMPSGPSSPTQYDLPDDHPERLYEDSFPDRTQHPTRAPGPDNVPQGKATLGGFLNDPLGTLGTALGSMDLGTAVLAGATGLDVLNQYQNRKTAEEERREATAKKEAEREKFNAPPPGTLRYADMARDPRTAAFDYSRRQDPSARQHFTDINPAPRVLGAKKGGLAHIDDAGMHFGGEDARGQIVTGPGGGQDDKVPALLSPSEYVIDADVVAAIGDGDPAEGARKLDKWREKIRKHKRSASVKKIPPKARDLDSYMKGA